MPTLQILDEGKHHVVVNKPANMVVVRGRGVPRPTLLDLVEERFGNGARPVHRLDRPTTGCCAFAKTPFGQQALSEAFRRRLVDKRYLALVDGEPTFTKIVLDARLLRVDTPDARKGPLARQTIDESGQRALTRVRVLGKANGKALLLCQPETGRMHQIRAHLADAGHPIVGDALYGGSSCETLGPHHVALHALLLGLPKPEGGRAFVCAPVEKTFEETGKGAGLDVRALTKEVSDGFVSRQSKAPPKKAAPRDRRPKSSPRKKKKAGPRRRR